LANYNIFVQRAVNNISVCAALAEDELKKSQRVGIKMKDGLLYASPDINDEAKGVTISGAKPGEDVGICNIDGIVPLDIGGVTIIKVPGIERGGSRKVDYNMLKKSAKDSPLIISLGLESYVALRKTGVEFYRYGAAEAAIESSRSGLNPLVVCTENETSELINRLEKEKIRYRLIEAEKL
jgi:putative transcriptional regulator